MIENEGAGRRPVFADNKPRVKVRGPGPLGSPVWQMSRVTLALEA